MKQIITIVIITILLFNILGCSTIKIKDEHQLTEKQKYNEKEELITSIGGLFGIGALILGGYIGYNFYPGNESGSEIIKIPGAFFGSMIGLGTSLGIFILSITIMENTVILDTKISQKWFNDKEKDK